jgi:hypothetical protein
MVSSERATVSRVAVSPTRHDGDLPLLLRMDLSHQGSLKSIEEIAPCRRQLFGGKTSAKMKLLDSSSMDLPLLLFTGNHGPGVPLHDWGTNPPTATSSVLDYAHEHYVPGQHDNT